MKTNSNDLNPQKKKVFGDPEYSEEEDIYNREEKKSYDDKELPREQKEEEPISQSVGLDVPGANLDDPDEALGEEDEENNYYSLGGDDHSDLDEEEGQ
ncbi:MAG: hypothetical protein ABI237_18795 [Ginsengibacter sp.]